jgi:histo-blood group ABO system transferase
MYLKALKISFVWLIFSIPHLFGANVGLLIMATGKYICFVEPLINSAEKHFCGNHNVTYFVFTDKDLKESDNIVRVYQPRLGWPFDTMMRYHVYYKSKDLFSEQDYLYACDADMLFVDKVGDEILGERVATQHPGFVGKRGSYETNPLSLACVNESEGLQYFAGGFYGGSRDEFLKIIKTNADNIDNDLGRGIIAVWHDESHWNRYCIDHPPTLILNPSYCYPESWILPYPKKLLALDKNHSEMRNN